jgi:hypothetical protein
VVDRPEQVWGGQMAFNRAVGFASDGWPGGSVSYLSVCRLSKV